MPRAAGCPTPKAGFKLPWRRRRRIADSSARRPKSRRCRPPRRAGEMSDFNAAEAERLRRVQCGEFEVPGWTREAMNMHLDTAQDATARQEPVTHPAIVITGAASGIGREIARLAAREGSFLLLVDRSC